jgi:hypothetical protein
MNFRLAGCLRKHATSTANTQPIGNNKIRGIESIPTKKQTPSEAKQRCS